MGGDRARSTVCIGGGQAPNRLTKFPRTPEGRGRPTRFEGADASRTPLATGAVDAGGAEHAPARGAANLADAAAALEAESTRAGRGERVAPGRPTADPGATALHRPPARGTRVGLVADEARGALHRRRSTATRRALHPSARRAVAHRVAREAFRTRRQREAADLAVRTARAASTGREITAEAGIAAGAVAAERAVDPTALTRAVDARLTRRTPLGTADRRQARLFLRARETGPALVAEALAADLPHAAARAARAFFADRMEVVASIADAARLVERTAPTAHAADAHAFRARLAAAAHGADLTAVGAGRGRGRVARIARRHRAVGVHARAFDTDVGAVAEVAVVAAVLDRRALAPPRDAVDLDAWIVVGAVCVREALEARRANAPLGHAAEPFGAHAVGATVVVVAELGRTRAEQERGEKRADRARSKSLRSRRGWHRPSLAGAQIGSEMRRKHASAS
jgi:hypothetical protein